MRVLEGGRKGERKTGESGREREGYREERGVWEKEGFKDRVEGIK